MDVKKVLFISQEIAPYVPERRLSQIGRLLPQGIKEQGIEERTFMPKYGMISRFISFTMRTTLPAIVLMNWK